MTGISKLPEGIRCLIEESAHGRRGFILGAVYMYEIIKNLDKVIEEKALEETEYWFEQQIVGLEVDEIFTPELEEKHGIPFLGNIKDEWAWKFFMRLEWEKEQMKERYLDYEYCKEGENRP